MSYIYTRIDVFDLLFFMSYKHTIDIIMPNLFLEKHRVSGLWNKKKMFVLLILFSQARLLNYVKSEYAVNA